MHVTAMLCLYAIHRRVPFFTVRTQTCVDKHVAKVSYFADDISIRSAIH